MRVLCSWATAVACCAGLAHPAEASAAPDFSALWDLVDRSAASAPLQSWKVEQLLSTQMLWMDRMSDGSMFGDGDWQEWRGGPIAVSPGVTLSGVLVYDRDGAWWTTVYHVESTSCVSPESIRARYPEAEKTPLDMDSDPSAEAWALRRPAVRVSLGVQGQPQCLKSVIFVPPKRDK
ncbi:MAG: hypothetical protein ACRC20_04090 [Segniliparus sp.]|uniref:hypothetical protein n=1 Tax=Segniliparus sp. TaxID=2804064 RepID=UPI003F3536FC